MRARVQSLIAVAIVILAAAALTAWRGSPRSAVDHAPDQEVERIRARLATVEAELLAADLSHLSPAQRAARSRHIAVLRDYRMAGVFPHNHTVPDGRVPVFVDEHGTHCAVGYLLVRDGRHDIVERVRIMRNNATVPQLADDPDLVSWLAQAGLTLEEAARIQPWYGPLDPAETTDRSYRNATLVAAGLGGGVSAWNLAAADAAGGRALRGVLGMGVGAAGIALGTAGLIDRAGPGNDADSGVEPAYIAVNFGVGVMTAALGLRTLLRDPPQAPRSNGADAASPRGVQWRLSPWAHAAERGAGVRLDVRF